MANNTRYAPGGGYTGFGSNGANGSSSGAPIPKRLRKKSVSFNGGVEGGINAVLNEAAQEIDAGVGAAGARISGAPSGGAPVPDDGSKGLGQASSGKAFEKRLAALGASREGHGAGVERSAAGDFPGLHQPVPARPRAGGKPFDFQAPSGGGSSSETVSNTPMTAVAAGETPLGDESFSQGWESWGSARRPAHKRRLSVPRMDEYAEYADEVDEVVEEEGEDDEDEDDDVHAAAGRTGFDRSRPFSEFDQSSMGSTSDGESSYRAARGGPSSPAGMLGGFDDWEVGPRYRMKRSLGHGSYGEVAEAYDRLDNRRVAIKRIQNIFDQEVDAKRIYREMHILRHLRHDKVIWLLDVIKPRDYKSFRDLYLVFEIFDTDLYKLITSDQFLTNEHIKTFLYQMLVALKYIHSAHVVHRDMKPANILLNEDCKLKICDFGLARVVCPETIACTAERDPDASNEESCGSVGDGSSNAADGSSGEGEGGTGRRIRGNDETPTRTLKRQLTKHVVTRWYRAPELILLQDYTNAVDVWSLGCIFAELLSMQAESSPRYQERVPLFPGKSCFPLSADVPTTYTDKLDQLNVIFDVIGTPSEDDIAALGEVQQYLTKLPPQERRPLETMYKGAKPEALDLLRRMLQFNPAQRVTVEEALDHPYLASIRNVNKERRAKDPLYMELEDTKLDRQTLKEHVYQEVLTYHPPHRHAQEAAALAAVESSMPLRAPAAGLAAAATPPRHYPLAGPACSREGAVARVNGAGGAAVAGAAFAHGHEAPQRA